MNKSQLNMITATLGQYMYVSLSSHNYFEDAGRVLGLRFDHLSVVLSVEYCPLHEKLRGARACAPWRIDHQQRASLFPTLFVKIISGNDM